MSSAAARVPTVVSPVTGTTTGQTTTQSVEVTPLRTQRFTGMQLSTPGDIARQLNQMQEDIKTGTQPARSNPHNQHTLFESQNVVTGTPLKLTHGFGRKVQWMCARWRNAAVGESLYEGSDGQSDNNTLILNTAVNGTADIEVW